jgi:hypothetical protein
MLSKVISQTTMKSCNNTVQGFNMAIKLMKCMGIQLYYRNAIVVSHKFSKIIIIPSVALYVYAHFCYGCVMHLARSGTTYRFI